MIKDRRFLLRRRKEITDNATTDEALSGFHVWDKEKQHFIIEDITFSKASTLANLMEEMQWTPHASQ